MACSLDEKQIKEINNSLAQINTYINDCKKMLEQYQKMREKNATLVQKSHNFINGQVEKPNNLEGV